MTDSRLIRYRNRDIYPSDLEFIRLTIQRHFSRGRSQISRILCKSWDWRQASGALKECACRDLLLRLEERGLVQLPPRLNVRPPRRPITQEVFNFEPDEIIEGDFSKVVVRPIILSERAEWRGLIDRHHYLGDRIIVGEHLLYYAFIGSYRVACIAWASAAKNGGEREKWIGWDPKTKRQNLPYVVNNTRFLILPWVKIKNLASRILSLNLKRLSWDWQEKYAHRVYLAETFVENNRFHGTCYKASNWIYLGQTKGLSKRGNEYHQHGNRKGIYVYPLHRHTKDFLCGRRG